jgi:flagellar hook-associated protein 2
MAISFGSINTGLPKDIVAQLMNVEKIPLTKMEERKGKIEDKVKLVSELIDLVQKLKLDVDKNSSSRGLKEFSVATNNDLIDVVVDKDIAEVGEYQLEVVQLAQKSSAMTSGFKDPDQSYVGVGYLQYELPNGEVRDIYIDSSNASLRGVAKLVNTNPDLGMRASVINDGTDSDKPWRLVLTLNETGDSNFASFPYFYFVDGEDDFFLEHERESKDAIVKLDGFEIEIPANKTSDLIPGLTIDLKKAKPGEEFPLKISENIKAITEKIEIIIQKINDVLNFIHKQNDLDEKSDTSRTLGGDSSLQTLESRIRGSVINPVLTQSGFKRIADLGIMFNRNGILEMDSKKFESYMTKNFKISNQILTGHTNEDKEHFMGFLENLRVVGNTSLQKPDGFLDLRKEGLGTVIKQIDSQIESRQRLLDQKEIILKDKFSRLESTISKIRGQGAGLSSLSGGADPIAQLG